MKLRTDALLAILGLSIGLAACGAKQPEGATAAPGAVAGPAAAPGVPPADASFEATFGISPYPGSTLIQVITGTEAGNAGHYRGNAFSSPDARDKVIAYYRDQLKRYTASTPAHGDGSPPFEETDLKEDGMTLGVGEIGDKPGFSVAITPLNSGSGTQISITWKPIDKTQS